MDAELEFPSGATALARCCMTSDRREFSCRIVGSRGSAFAPNFVKPHLDDCVVVRIGATERVEHLGTRPPYTYQLDASADAVRRRAPLPIGPDDAVTSTRLIDDTYLAAGFMPHQAR